MRMCEFCKVKPVKKRKAGWGFRTYCSMECRLKAQHAGFN